MKTFSKNLALTTVAILGVTSLAVGAHADESGLGANSRTVRYSDLNLGSEAGAKALYQRIRGAAKQVCGDVDSRQFDQAAAAKACMERAIVSSVHAVHSAQLTSTANAHGFGLQTTFNVASLR